VQEQLNKAGFKVELKNQELGQFVQDWRNSISTCSPRPMPAARSGRLFLPHLPHGGSTNVFKYSDPEIDGLLDKARIETDQAERKAPMTPCRRSSPAPAPWRI
jgi:peptide/nickel transport system substrate-binding protein